MLLYEATYLMTVTIESRVRITHYLPSGRYQVAMVPYIKDDNDTMIPMAPPSCSTRLLRINLGQYALHITFFLLLTVILSGIGTHFWQEGQEKELHAEMVKERVSLSAYASYYGQCPLSRSGWAMTVQGQMRRSWSRSILTVSSGRLVS